MINIKDYATLPAYKLAGRSTIEAPHLTAPSFVDPSQFASLQLDPYVEQLIMPYIQDLIKNAPALTAPLALAVILATDPATKKKTETLAKAASPYLFNAKTVITTVGPSAIGKFATTIGSKIASARLAQMGKTLTDNAAVLAAADASGDLDTLIVLISIVNETTNVYDKFYKTAELKPSNSWATIKLALPSMPHYGGVTTPQLAKRLQASQLLITGVEGQQTFDPMFTAAEFAGAWRQIGAVYERLLKVGPSLMGDIKPDHVIVHKWGEKRASTTHKGIDIRATTGTKLFAPAGGTVVEMKTQDPANPLAGWGKYIVIKPHHSRYYYLVAHLSKFNSSLRKGSSVLKGSWIGDSGYSVKSGRKQPHVHFEIRTSNAQGGWFGPTLDPDTALAMKAANWHDLFNPVTSTIDTPPAQPEPSPLPDIPDMPEVPLPSSLGARDVEPAEVTRKREMIIPRRNKR